MRRLTLQEALWAIELLPKYIPSAEPIGPITQRGVNSLESAINAPFISFGGRYKYRYHYQKAAVLFYMIAKDHAIGNGNKRCAVMLTTVFLVMNDKMFNLSPDELYNVATTVANGDARSTDRNIRALAALFKRSIIDFTDI